MSNLTLEIQEPFYPEITAEMYGRIKMKKRNVKKRNS